MLNLIKLILFPFLVCQLGSTVSEGDAVSGAQFSTVSGGDAGSDAQFGTVGEGDDGAGAQFPCSYCDISFHLAHELHVHCRSDLHQKRLDSEDGCDWKHRPPPRGLTAEEYTKCPR